MYNFAFPLREAAVMVGNSYDVALEMMEELRQTQNMDNGLFATYTNIFLFPWMILESDFCGLLPFQTGRSGS